MGGFLGIGHSSAKTDRGMQLGGMGGLLNIFNWAMPQGKAAYGTGMEDLGAAGGYWKNLLSGNRAAMQQAVAPETASVLGKEDATRRGISAMGTARGGGTAGAQQTAHDRSMSEIDNLLFGVQPAAARETANIGRTEIGAGENLLGLGTGAISDYTHSAIQSRPISAELNARVQQQWGTVIGDVLGALL